MTDAKKEKTQKIISTMFAVFAVGFLLFIVVNAVPAFGDISDFPEYYAPARLTIAGHGADAFTFPGLTAAEHEFFPSMKERIVPLFVPPPGLSLLSPVAFLPLPLAPLIWKLLLVTCVAGSIALLKKMFRLNYTNTCYLLTGVCFSYACFEALRIDQLAPILLLALVSACFFLVERKDVPAGIALAILILKPQQILPFLLYLAGGRRWKTLGVTIALISLLTVIAFVQLGPQGFTNYLEYVRNPESLRHMQPELTPTFRGQLMRFLPMMTGAIFSITTLIYAGAALFSAYFGNKFRNDKNFVFLGLLAILPLSIICSVHCHDYDLLLLVPAVLIALSDRVVTLSQFAKLGLILGGLVFMSPIAVEIHYSYLLKGGIFNVWFWELLIFVGYLIFKCWRQTPETA